MADLHLANKLGDIADIPLNLALPRDLSADVTISTIALIYWRFEDEPDKKPQFLKEIPAGQSYDWPTDPKGRPIRFFMISKTKTGVPTTKEIYEGVQLLFDPGASSDGSEKTVICGEDLDLNDLVYFYNDGGTSFAKKADATDATKPCQGFAGETKTTNDQIRIFLPGNIIHGLTGKTAGVNQYLSDTTPGTMTETPPITAGHFYQQIGVAVDMTSVSFHPLTGTTIPVSGAPPAPPSGLTAIESPSGTAHLTWTNNGGTGTITIERKYGTGSFATLVTGLADSTVSYDDATPSPGSNTYRVTNISVAGYSNEANVTISGSTFPPSALTAEKTYLSDCEWQVDLSWTAGSGAANYTLEVKINSGGSWGPAITTIPGTSYTTSAFGSSTPFVIYYRVKQNDVTGYTNEASLNIPRCFPG